MAKPYHWKTLSGDDRYYIDEDDPSITHPDDPYFMDVVHMYDQWWLCQFDVHHDSIKDSLLGPYPTMKAAKLVAEMMYKTLVVKLK